MTKFVPISELDENLALSPEFYFESGAAPLDSTTDAGPVPLLPPLNQEEAIANGTLLALFDAGIASRSTGASFVLLQAQNTGSGGNADSPGATLKYFLWNGRTFETRQIQIANANVNKVCALIEEEGILSKSAAAAGITGATPSLSSVLAAVEDFPLELWPFLSALSWDQGAFGAGPNTALSEALQNALDDWLEAPKALDGILLRPAAGIEDLREALLFQFKSTEQTLEPRREGESPFARAWQSYAPSVGLIKLSPRSLRGDFYVAFIAPSLSRDLLVHFMDALGLRLNEQQEFLERCWQIIGSEISSRVRHMFKNRIGSAYDEIRTVTRVATEGGWISTPTEPPEVITVLKEKYRDSEDYCRVGASLGRVQENLKALERAVDQLSKFYREFRGTPEVMSVNSAVEVQLVNWRAARHDVEICKELDQVDPVCLIVPGALAEILDNIFGNSQKFIPKELGHHIFVSTKLSRDKVVITIANDGPSELPDQPTKLFVTTDPQGTGVGLHLVERLVSEAGGAFSISSRPDGPGVLNRIELPNPKWKSET